MLSSQIFLGNQSSSGAFQILDMENDDGIWWINVSESNNQPAIAMPIETTTEVVTKNYKNKCKFRLNL